MLLSMDLYFVDVCPIIFFSPAYHLPDWEQPLLFYKEKSERVLPVDLVLFLTLKHIYLPFIADGSHSSLQS